MNKSWLALTIGLLISVVFLTGCDLGDLVEEKNQDKSVSLTESFELKINETAIVEAEQFKVTFLEVTTDSRCPSGVMCVWAGEVIVKIKVTKDDKDWGEHSVSTIPNEIGRRVVRVDNYAIDFVDIKPSKQEKKEIKPADYLATFKITKQ